MKRLILVISVLFTASVYPQQTFFSILEHLSANTAVEITNIPNSNDFFKSLNSRTSFTIGKSDTRCCTLGVILVNSYLCYDIYAIIVIDSRQSDAYNTFDSVLFYDNKLKRCFVVEYGFDQSFYLSDDNLCKFNSDFTSDISKITEIDSALNPLTTTDINYMEGDSIYKCSRYLIAENGCVKTSRFFEIPIAFKDLPYSTFLKIHYHEENEYKQDECSKQDNIILNQFITN